MSVREHPARTMTKVGESAPFLGIALPVRKRSPVDFWMNLYQLLPPLNTKINYMIQKGDEKDVVDGKLPAAARNALIERGLSQGMKYMFFLDDDVLIPDIALYRMWVMIQKHPEIACITAIGGTKLNPSEPLVYQEGVQGAWWDWQLGALTPIHSAWAGCMLVDLNYVKKVKEPWFDDVIYSIKKDDTERVKQNIWGHDRFFHQKLKNEAGGLVCADTGLLVAHYDADLQKAYILPPDSPCFQKPILGESFIPFFGEDGYIAWTRVIVPDLPDREFKGYLNWLKTLSTPKEEQPLTIVSQEKEIKKIENREGYTVVDSRRRMDEGEMDQFHDWFKEVGASE